MEQNCTGKYANANTERKQSYRYYLQVTNLTNCSHTSEHSHSHSSKMYLLNAIYVSHRKNDSLNGGEILCYCNIEENTLIKVYRKRFKYKTRKD